MATTGLVADSAGSYKPLRKALEKIRSDGTRSIIHLGGIFVNGIHPEDVSTVKLLRELDISALKGISDYSIAKKLVQEWRTGKERLVACGYSQKDIDYIYTMGTHRPGSDGFTFGHSSMTLSDDARTLAGVEDAICGFSKLKSYCQDPGKRPRTGTVRVYVRGDSKKNFLVRETEEGVSVLEPEFGERTDFADMNYPCLVAVSAVKEGNYALLNSDFVIFDKI